MTMHDFHFLRPAWLLALPVVLPVVVRMWRRAAIASDWMRVCDPHLLRHLASPSAEAKRSRWPAGLVLAAWLASCVAIAGPTWQRLPQLSFENTDRTVLVLGLSPSLDARDVAPSRLARGRHKLLDAVDHLDGGSVGLIVYREEAFVASPLTDDAQVLRELIPILETDLAPGRAVYASRGLEEAKALLDPVGTLGAQVLLVSDGADDDPAATRAAAAALSRAGARVSVLGIAGSDAQLASVAAAGGGTFAPLAPNDADLDQLLKPSESTLGQTVSKSDIRADAWRDMGAWLVWVPLLIAPLAFRRGWATAALALALVQFTVAPAEAGVRDWFERPDQRGARAFQAGDYATSAERFADPAWQAAARYRAGDFDAAASALESRNDPTSLYNRGNALAKSGRLSEALEAFDSALASNPDDEDARYNRELVKKLLDAQSSPPSRDQTGRDSDESAQGNQGAASDSAESDGANQDAQSQASDAANGADASSGAPQDGRGHDPGDGGNDSANADDPGDGGNDSADADDPGQGGNESAKAGDGAPSGEGDPRGDHAASPSASEAADARPASQPPTTDAAGDAVSPLDDTDAAAQAGGGPAMSDSISPEEEAAQRWIAHLPDDPGGLLREKIRRDYLRKRESRQQGERR